MAVNLYKDISIGVIPPTPATPYTETRPTTKANDAIIEFALTLGYPIGYAQEQKGRVVQDIVPVYKTENAQISTSSKTELALHTETAFHPYKPDYVLLLCLRSDPFAETTYANLDDIIPKLSSQTLSILSESLFITTIDQSFRTNGEPDTEVHLPVLKDNTLIYDDSVMRGINSDATHALEDLRQAIDSSVRAVALKESELLVIDNKTAVHGRRPFQPKYDGTDRWLKRALVIQHLPPESDYNNGVVTTKFTQ